MSYSYNDIDLITPTAYKKVALEKLDALLCRMEGAGEFRWIVSNGGSRDLPDFKYPNTVVLENDKIPNRIKNFLNNLGAAINHSSRELLVFVEDDDWYRSDYLTNRLALHNTTSAGLVGLDFPTHYHLGMRCMDYREPKVPNGSPLHATSLCRSALTDFMGNFDHCRRKNRWELDIRVWTHMESRQAFRYDGSMVSLKGWAEGMTAHHNFERHKFWNYYDPDLKFLRHVMGEDIELYKIWWENHKKMRFMDKLKSVVPLMGPINIELIGAIYGVPGDAEKQKDVTQIIQQYLDARDYDFTISNTVAGGDPAPGIVKTLVLMYKLDGKLYEKKIPENEQISFL